MPLYRSVLYVPASNPKAMAKVPQLLCDSVIFDLEDAVDPAKKPAARDALLSALRKPRVGKCQKMVRINALTTPWGKEDAQAVARMECDGVLLPKVARIEDIDALHKLTPGLPVWIMIETALGVLNVASLVAHPQVAGLVAGTNDLGRDLRLRGPSPRRAMLGALQSMVLGARAAGAAAIDGVFNAPNDLDGLCAEAEEGRNFGFDGKSVIHPAQIEPVNKIFCPTSDELEQARRVIEAYEQAATKGQGIAVLDGEIIEALHAQRAMELIEEAKEVV